MSNNLVQSVEIQTIDHKNHRYPTVGDWQFFPEEGHLLVLVSDTGEWRTNQAIAVHELIEALLCISDGVNQKDVDDFDILYEKHKPEEDPSEPGDSKYAPYRHQHAIASAVERLLIEELGTSWADYESDLEALDA